ncbi:hypothetical protein PRIPAC_86983 [Pristionchus pacificus]|uniref:Uncharacterized protein n=1 Tax=Pristionchus pacificus TaxID=54126 RepID=A0A2A6BN90_PRIPA|nr:hypothetical protein PRIPAC_86983 [Pristionchus pacificus]|eukprot:PDM67380.1 hypothetical protein PRIPAC_48797 [Pristionchus pacificus]
MPSLAGISAKCRKYGWLYLDVWFGYQVANQLDWLITLLINTGIFEIFGDFDPLLIASCAKFLFVMVWSRCIAPYLHDFSQTKECPECSGCKLYREVLEEMGPLARSFHQDVVAWLAAGIDREQSPLELVIVVMKLTLKKCEKEVKKLPIHAEFITEMEEIVRILEQTLIFCRPAVGA